MVHVYNFFYGDDRLGFWLETIHYITIVIILIIVKKKYFGPLVHNYNGKKNIRISRSLL